MKQRRSRKRKKGSGIGGILRHYIFLWPSLRTYYTLFIGYFKKNRKKKKEKVIIIE